MGQGAWAFDFNHMEAQKHMTNMPKLCETYMESYFNCILEIIPTMIALSYAIFVYHIHFLYKSTQGQIQKNHASLPHNCQKNSKMFQRIQEPQTLIIPPFTMNL